MLFYLRPGLIMWNSFWHDWVLELGDWISTFFSSRLLLSHCSKAACDLAQDELGKDR